MTKETRPFFMWESVLKMHYGKVFTNVGIENRKYSKFKIFNN